MNQLLAEKYKAITTYVVEDFLNEKRITLKCHTCNNETFSMVEIYPSVGTFRAGDSLGRYVNIYKNESLYPGGLPQLYFSFTCKNCGTAIHINPDVVLAWHQGRQQLDDDTKNG